MAYPGNTTAAFFVGMPFFGDPNEDFVHYPDNPSPYVPSERQVVSIIQILFVVCACVFLWIWPMYGAAHQLCNTPSSVKNVQSMPYLLSSALKSIGISPQIGNRRISPIVGDIKIDCSPKAAWFDNFTFIEVYTALDPIAYMGCVYVAGMGKLPKAPSIRLLQATLSLLLSITPPI